MKTIYILPLLLLSSIGVFAQGDVVNIPDAEFKKALLNNKPAIDTNGDGEIQKSEAEAFTGKIDLNFYAEISDLTGIEFFVNITELDCSNSKLKHIDISKNVKLTKFSFYKNRVTDLDISKNINLEMLNCSENQLTQLDISKNLVLKYLFCGNNKLTQLDISKNTALEHLDLRGFSPHYPMNQLKQLDVSNNINLISLNCSKGELTQLDVSKNTKLKELFCKENELTQLDVSENIELEVLNCAENRLQQLDVSKNLNLKELWCGYNSGYNWLGNQLTQLDISKNINLETLYCSNNQLKQLDVSKNINLKHLHCSNNQLSQLDVSKNTKLKSVDCSRNTIDLRGLWAIKSLLPSGCALEYKKQDNIYSIISVSEVIEVDYTSQAVINGNNTVFKWYNVSGELVDDNNLIEPVAGITGKFSIKNNGAFYCQMSNPEFPDLKINTKLICFSSSTEEVVDIPDVILKGCLLKDKAINTNQDGEIQLSEAHSYKSKIWVFNKGIKSLKGIESFVNITELHCRGNGLRQIDVSKNTELRTLICNNNQLTQLDVSKNVKLSALHCGHNQLTQLDLSENTELVKLDCSDNKLTQLDVSKNTKLAELDCYHNQLTQLDVSNNKELTSLSCFSNQIKQLDVSKNVKISELYCAGNQLSQLDLSKSIELTKLSCTSNQFSEFDISKNTKLESFSCERNKLTFSELWSIKSNLSADAYFDYKPQNKVYKEQYYKLNAEIDYSSELTINGKTTSFKWYNEKNDSEVDETYVQKTEDGKFKFLKYGEYYCKMSNAEFDDLELQTNTIYILKDQTITFDIQKTVFVNDKITLNTTASTGLDVTYEIVSGKATLDGNVLTATTEGALVVKAVQAGNAEYAKAEKEVTIQVSKRNQTITFTVEGTVKVNDKITLEATASTGLDITYEIVSGEATLNGNIVTFTKAGVVEIKATQAGNGEYKLVEKTVSVTVTKSTAIDMLQTIGAKIYPNPVTDILNIELPTTENYTVSIYNSIGDVVTQTATTSSVFTIDMSAYKSGIYIVKINTNNKSYSGKIVKR